MKIWAIFWKGETHFRFLTSFSLPNYLSNIFLLNVVPFTLMIYSAQ